MIKKLIIVTFISLLAISACSTTVAPEAGLAPASTSAEISVTMRDVTFEYIIENLASDVVIAQYVGRRTFGQHLTELEFVVSERLLGDAEDRIFIYIDKAIESSQLHGLLYFDFAPGVDYLLPIDRRTSAYFHARYVMYLCFSIVIDLDTPLNSTMLHAPLYLHSSGLNFSERDFTRQDILSYVASLSENNQRYDEEIIIMSEYMEDVVLGSPLVLLVEISDIRRLSRNGTDWMDTDIFYVTVIDALKGDYSAVYEMVMLFFAGTVNVGEQHIVAVQFNPSRGSSLRFTSRNSLFHISQLDEIKQILSPHQVSFDLNYGEYDGDQNLLIQAVIHGRNATGLSTDPTRYRYIFTGWHPELNLDDVTEDRTFTAQWQLDRSPWNNLGKIIAMAEALLPYENSYTQATWATLISNLQYAREVYDNNNATLQEIATAEENLLSAIDALALIPVIPPGTGQQPPDTGQQPPGTGQQPPGIGQQPPGTGQQPPGTGQQPPGTGQQPPGTGQQPPDTGQQPTGTGQQPPGTGQQPPGTGQPSGTGQQPPQTYSTTPNTPLLPLVTPRPPSTVLPSQDDDTPYPEDEYPPPYTPGIPSPPALEQIMRLVIGSTAFTYRGNPMQSDVAPFINPADNRTMVPLRIITDALGVNVRFDSEPRTVYLIQNGQEFSLVIDRPLPNDMGVPVIINSRTLVPARYVSEILGAIVRWDSVNRAVYIYVMP